MMAGLSLSEAVLPFVFESLKAVTRDWRISLRFVFLCSRKCHCAHKEMLTQFAIGIYGLKFPPFTIVASPRVKHGWRIEDVWLLFVFVFVGILMFVKRMSGGKLISPDLLIWWHIR